MSLVEQLKQDMITAMKEKDKERLTVIRMVKAALDKGTSYSSTRIITFFSP